MINYWNWHLDFSWRYGVVGLYKDRKYRLIRVYPFPFVRLTLVYSQKR